MKAFPGFGQPEASVPAIEEPHTNLAFDVVDSAAQSGLCHVQTGSRTRQTSFLRHHNGALQIVDCDIILHVKGLRIPYLVPCPRD